MDYRAFKQLISSTNSASALVMSIAGALSSLKVQKKHTRQGPGRRSFLGSGHAARAKYNSLADAQRAVNRMSRLKRSALAGRSVVPARHILENDQDARRQFGHELEGV
ncbi:MAG: hypothetical protein COB49_02115 [Alphaproteobacteria bacterium]|nr:MAG: hypothetical protein COB49_02115 [Alphaproteobacteria bacterium]